MDVGLSVGVKGLDGVFGPDTSKAVTAYKTDRGLSPNDPVVGPGTMGRLDAELFFDPPELDPTFREFSPLVVSPGSSRLSASSSPRSSGAAGLVAPRHRHVRADGPEFQGAARDRRREPGRGYPAPFLADAAPMQPLPNGTQVNANDFFTNNTTEFDRRQHGLTVDFAHRSGVTHQFMLVGDDVILGKAATHRPAPPRRARNAAGRPGPRARPRASSRLVEALRTSPNNAPDSFVDPGAAAVLSTPTNPSAGVMATYIDELVADHVEWVVRKEVEGNPAAIPASRSTSSRPRFASGFCDPTASATTATWRSSTPRATRSGFARSTSGCAGPPNSRSRVWPRSGCGRRRVRAAAAFCAGQAANPTALPEPDGTHPLLRDFQSRRLGERTFPAPAGLLSHRRRPRLFNLQRVPAVSMPATTPPG